MSDFFRLHALLELQQNDEAWKLCESLRERFGESAHLQTQMALVHYNMLLDERKIFSDLAKYPHMDCMDTYSNILYVKGIEELSRLAIDRFGTTISTGDVLHHRKLLREGRPSKAVVYLLALRLNRHFCPRGRSWGTSTSS